MNSHDRYTRKILAEIEAGRPVTQRSLARELGIALGLTNLLIRRLVSKGLVKVVNIRPNRVRYLITPAGIAEKSRITRQYLNRTLKLYTETRERIRESLDTLSLEWSPADGDRKRVVFYGAGEVAEIGYVSLQGTDLLLIGVVDDVRTKPFFGMPVHPPDRLRPTDLNGERFGRLVVMSFKRAGQIRARLTALGFPPDRVYWI